MRLYVDGFVQVALYILTALLSPKNIKELHRQLRQTEQSIIFPMLCLMTVLNELGDSDRPKLDLALSHLLRQSAESTSIDVMILIFSIQILLLALEKQTKIVS